MTQGRPKGCKAEIEVAKTLEPWWAKLEPECKFVRTPLSGGWGGKEVRAGFKASGDLMTTAKRFPFAVEVKRREGWSWKTLLGSKKCPVWVWWHQAIGQAEEMGTEPTLWVRKNREPWFVMLPCRLLMGFTMKDLKAVWAPDELAANGVDYGELAYFPWMVTAEMFLSKGPEFWAVAAEKQRVQSTKT